MGLSRCSAVIKITDNNSFKQKLLNCIRMAVISIVKKYFIKNVFLLFCNYQKVSSMIKNRNYFFQRSCNSVGIIVPSSSSVVMAIDQSEIYCGGVLNQFNGQQTPGAITGKLLDRFKQTQYN